MSRTLIGQLILRLRAEGLGEADKVQSRMRDVEAAARRLANTPAGTWGRSFQRQLDALKLAPREMEAVRTSWQRLTDDMRRRNIAASLRSSEISAWKNATVTAFASARSEHAAMTAAIERNAQTHVTRMRNLMRPVMVAGGFYTGAYGFGLAGRSGVTASATEERERFRQDMAGIPEGEQEAIYAEASRLSGKYRAASFTEIAEMARTARAMMGGTERGLAVLERMVQGLVALKSTKGPDSGPSEISRLLRGIDNLGQNASGPEGIEATKAIIDGLVRASQIEGLELDAGKLFDFARRGKIAAPALSTEFIATVAAALMQDMTAEGFGTALSSAYQSLVIGSNATASKVNLAEQKRLGLRSGAGKGELIDPELFGLNPYEWVQKHLVPALQRDGVDTSNDVQVAQAVAMLARNTLATGMLARMIQQREQIDRLVLAYSETMGVAAAEEASTRDPFLAWEGFKNSLQNLSGAMGGMPAIVSGLNSFTDGINRLQQAIRDGDPAVTKAAAIGGVAAGGGLAYVLGKGVYGLMTAGTNLNVAAANLNRAAVALGGAGVADRASGPGGGKAGKAGLLALLGRWSGIASALMLSGSTANNPYLQLTDEERKAQREAAHRAAAAYNERRSLYETDRAQGRYGPSSRTRRGRDANGAWDAIRGSVPTLAPQLDIGEITIQAQTAGTEIEQALSVTGRPTIDTSQLQQAVGLAKELVRLIGQASAGAVQARQNVGAEMRRNFADGTIGGP